MKRQSGNNEIEGGEKTINKAIKKKTKGTAAAATKQVEEKAAEEERKAVEEEGNPATVEWGCLWSGVELDEEMPWATSWIPFWEVDAYEALYGDVLWDFDIWDFKKNQNGLSLAPFP